jgi:hypothetical protein
VGRSGAHPFSRSLQTSVAKGRGEGLRTIWRAPFAPITIGSLIKQCTWGFRAGLFAANPRAFRLRSGRCGFSAAIPARGERAGTWGWVGSYSISFRLDLKEYIDFFFVPLSLIGLGCF